MTVWFSGDQHLSHDSKHGGIIQYCNRPFESLKEMNSVIIDRMLEKVRKGDTLYSLGDLTFKKDVALKFVEIIKKNNINLVYIRGNHDKNILPILNSEGIKVYDLLTINIAKQPIVLCHYAMRTWDKSCHNSWQIHAHSHHTLSPQGKQLDCGVDGFDFYPISYDTVRNIMKTRPDNFNLTKGRI